MEAKQAVLVPENPLPLSQPSQSLSPQATMQQMIQFAIENKAGIEVIERLYAIEKEIRADIASQEYSAAMSRVQSQVRAVFADLENKQTDSKYASYKALDDAVRPYYTSEGLELEFDTESTEQPDTLMVLCYVFHKGGHKTTRRVPIPIVTVGPQGKAVMTKTHATITAFTYGKKELLKAVFNIPVYGQKEDNDGNAELRVDADELQDRLKHIEQSPDAAELLSRYKAAHKWAMEAEDHIAVGLFIKAKNKTLAAFGKAKP